MPSDPLPEAAPYAAPRRLHPASVVLGLNLRQLVTSLLPGLAILATAGRFAITVLGLAALVGLAVRVVAWERFTFAFDGEVLRVEEGILTRSRRVLDVARIQQVEIDRPALQRLFGFASLRIETAGSSSEVEVELRVLPDADAVALRTAVRAGRARALEDQGRHRTGPDATGTADLAASGIAAADPGQGEGAPAQAVLRVPLRHVVLASVTGARLLVLPALLAAGLQLFGEIASTTFQRMLETLVEVGLASPEELIERPAPSTLALLVAAAVVLTVVSAVVVGVLRDAKLVVERAGDDLRLRRGLVSTRESVVPFRRIQLVEVQRNWVRRLLGVTSVRIHSAGGSGDADRRVAVPLLPDSQVDALVAALLPGVPAIPALVRHPPPALRRSVLRWVRPALLVPAALWLADALTPLDPPRAAGMVALAVPVAAAVLGAVEYRQLAHAITDRIVAARQGALVVTTALAPLGKVQGVSSRTSPFQRRLGLATVTAHLAGPGGDVEVLDAGAQDARGLTARLTAHAAAPAGAGSVRTPPGPPHAAPPGSRAGSWPR